MESENMDDPSNPQDILGVFFYISKIAVVNLLSVLLIEKCLLIESTFVFMSLHV